MDNTHLKEDAREQRQPMQVGVIGGGFIGPAHSEWHGGCLNGRKVS